MVNKRSVVEEKVFEAIDDIAEELKLNVNSYPEVHLVHRGLSFDDLWLPESKRERFEDLKDLGGSWYDDSLCMMFIGRNHPEDIAEEAGHFLHFTHSKIRYSGRTGRDKFSLNILVEAIGFFCSKLLIPSRKNTHISEPDLFFMTQKERQESLKAIDEKYGEYIATEFCLYQQARGLGERMHYAYINGNLSLDEFRRIFLCPFTGKTNPFHTFVELKMKYWAPK
jgi:hypothetical protein